MELAFGRVGNWTQYTLSVIERLRVGSYVGAEGASQPSFITPKFW